MWKHVLQYLFFLLIVKPLVYVIIGLNVRHRARLPNNGPLIIAANHNSHLDTLVLMSLFPLKSLSQLRPVAAADYFFKNKALKWFALNIMGIIPLSRHPLKEQGSPLAECHNALKKGQILIVFPEGSRGQAEEMAPFKTGIAHLAEAHPQVPILPIYLHGLGKTLPKNSVILVPFFCDIFIGQPVKWSHGRQEFMSALEQAFQNLAKEGHFSAWE